MKCLKCGFEVSIYSGDLYDKRELPYRRIKALFAICGCRILGRVNNDIVALERQLQMSVNFSQLERNFRFELDKLSPEKARQNKIREEKIEKKFRKQLETAVKGD